MRIVTLRKSIVFSVLALAMVGTLLPQTASAGVRSIANVASFDTTEAAGPSMVLDENDNPVIAYVNTSTNRLMILRCDDPACVSGGDITTTEAALTGRGWPSIALTNEGFPVVAYADGQDINVLRCNDPVCKGSDSLVGVASGALGFPTVEVTSDNHPVVLFVAEDLSMKVVACLNFNCNQRMGAISPVTGQQLGSPPRMRLDKNDRPVIANTLSGTGHLQLVKCNSQPMSRSSQTRMVPKTSTSDRFRCHQVASTWSRRRLATRICITAIAATALTFGTTWQRQPSTGTGSPPTPTSLSHRPDLLLRSRTTSTPGEHW